VPTLDRRPGRPAFHHQGPPTAPQAYIATAADDRTPKGPPSPLAAAAASGLDSQLMPPGLRDPVLRQGLVDMLSRRQGGVDAGNGGGGGLLQSMLSLAAGGRRQGARMTAQQQQQQLQQQLLMDEAAAAMRPSDSLQAPGRRRFRGGPSAMKYQQVRVDLHNLPGWLCWNFRTIYGARNRAGIGLSYRPTRLYIGWRNRSLGTDSWVP
jgi:hypothetical protein